MRHINHIISFPRKESIKFEKFYNLVKFLRPSFNKQKSNLLFLSKESKV